MAYQPKYRAECKTTRQNKDIRADILYDDYNLITGWTNGGGPVAYETFTTSGARITSAINTSGIGRAYSSEFALVDGDDYYVDIGNLVLNSGELPRIALYTSSGGTPSSQASDYTTLAAGDNKIRLKCTEASATGLVWWENENNSDHETAGDIMVFKGVVFSVPPVTISQAPADDPFDGQIIGSECRLRIMAETDLEFSEFLTCKNRDYQVKVYFDDSIVWAGYITADSYEEPYMDPPYEVELVAHDGIGDLRNIEYEETGPIDIRTFVDAALNTYLDVNWDWYDYVLNTTTGFEETAASASDAANVQFSEDRFTIESLEEYSSVYDILEAICKTFDARFIMDSGAWRWYRVAGQRSASHAWTEWQKGAGSDTGTTDHKKNITAPSSATPNCFIYNTQRLGVLPAYREFTLIHDYGYRDLLWKDYSFDYTDITTYWEGESGFSLSSTNRVGREMQYVTWKPYVHFRYTRSYIGMQIQELIKGKHISPTFAKYAPGKLSGYKIYKYVPETYCIDMGSGDTTPASILSSARVHYKETFTLQNSASANYGVNVKWDQKVDFDTDASTTLYVRAYHASWDRWLQEDGAWTATVSAMEFSVTSALQWQTFECLSEELSTSYEVTIHVYLSTAVKASGTISGTWFDNIELNIIRLDTDSMAINQTLTEAIDTDYNLVQELPIRLLGDIDEEGYEDTIYKGYLEANDGAGGHQLTQEWIVDGSRYQTLLEHSRDMHKCFRETPLWRLMATFYGDNNFMTVYTDTNESKDFFTNYATWNLQEMTWGGEFIELPAVSNDTTNLITGWTNDDWDTFTDTGAVIDTAVEGTGNADADSNTVPHDDGEAFHLAYSIVKNSGDWPTFNFAGDSHTATGTPGSATLTATSTDTTALGFDLGAGETADLGTCTIYLYRKYGY